MTTRPFGGSVPAVLVPCLGPISCDDDDTTLDASASVDATATTRTSVASAMLGSLLLASTTMLPPDAAAHLMVAQHGTLNLVDDGAFMVLSLPVSAFDGVDDDGDGQLSPAELRAHHDALLATVEREVRLIGDGEALPLQGLMLALSPPDDAAAGPASQLVALGRFALPGGDASLRFEVTLFGGTDVERSLEISVARPSDGRHRQFVLTPERSADALFPSP